MKTAIPPVPEGLSKEAASFWTRVTSQWELEDSALLVLRMACEALDEYRECQTIIRKEGRTVRDRWTQVRPHPCVTQARDARLTLLRCLKQLGLDLEPLGLHPGPKGGA